MSDWYMIGRNAMWLVGLALGLAVLGIAYDAAQREAAPLRDKLSRPGFQLALDLSLILCCLGLLFSGRAWWERVAWGLLAAAFATHMAWLWMRRRKM